ncbi:MAG: glucose-6-phosphate isomerase [Acidithiobacillus sp.]|nr:glucose-6-phosphate isomerase [Acidithiobacillus sp.]
MSDVNSNEPTPVSQTAIWKELQAHAQAMSQVTFSTLFRDAQRGSQFRAEGASIVFDYSRQHLTQHTLRLLEELAQECFISQQRDALFSGAPINRSENRPALHTALRMPQGDSLFVDGKNIVADVQAVLQHMGDFVEALWRGAICGSTGSPLRNVVNIGIGGSYLGPELLYQAMRRYRNPQIRVRFLANVDGAAFADAIDGLDPTETLFIVSSKTFTTGETIENFKKAQSWLRSSLGVEDVSAHFVAVTANLNEALQHEFVPDRIFAFWDWVGGRYSVSSAIGLSVMAAIGSQHFRDFLHGFHRMDENFRTASLSENLPLLHGLIAVWNNNFLGNETLAVLPYAHDLRRFPAYLQQLFMESNGKRVDQNGHPVSTDTCPILWGEPGTCGQHSFFQLLHQGTRSVASDFIGFLDPLDADPQSHDYLMASLFAQCEALAFGKDADALAAEGVPAEQIPHRVCPGNRPANILLAPALSPEYLGALIALYEHSVFVQGIIWGINSFDQWGVELGKQLAHRSLTELSTRSIDRQAHDSATVADMELYLQHRK